jgi:uncharacterized protein (TIGR02147 family)
MVLKGQRMPSEELVLAFSADLNHSESERRYFELLVRREKYRDSIPRALLEELQKLNPQLIKRKPLDAEVFSYVSAWHYCVILQIFQAPSFGARPLAEAAALVSRRLGGKIVAADAESSILLLERLKFLTRDAGGRLSLSAHDPLIAIEEVPSAAGRKHHSEQMEQAKEALQRSPMSEREFSCLTFRASRRKLPELKKAVREFRDKFEKEFLEGESEDVCQLNVQFFFHTTEEAK